MSRSLGTKETQGINGDAAALQRKFAAMAAASTGTTADPCPYEHHRETDWRLVDSPHVVCGACHPPAKTLETVAA